MANVELTALAKQFGAGLAVDHVDMTVPDGAFVALLGPSGCGKTTLLRLIAGLERPTSGRIVIDGRTIADDRTFVEPEDRGLAMVFQSYALWPHMTVAENVAFSLKVRGVTARERQMRVQETLATVGLTGLETRRPSELSGGQRQRVALARCLASRPRLILLDEPLANLDAHLRETMQREFRRIHRETGATFVYVTHDQAEAMALADRVAVMSHGRLVQYATPRDLYRQPADSGIAAFIGRTTLVPVEILEALPEGRRRVRLAGHLLDVSGSAVPGAGLLCLRPENVSLSAGGTGAHALTARVRDVTFRGHAYALRLAFDALPDIEFEVEAIEPHPLGAEVAIGLRDLWVVAAPASHGGRAGVEPGPGSSHGTVMSSARHATVLTPQASAGTAGIPWKDSP